VLLRRFEGPGSILFLTCRRDLKPWNPRVKQILTENFLVSMPTFVHRLRNDLAFEVIKDCISYIITTGFLYGALQVFVYLISCFCDRWRGRRREDNGVVLATIIGEGIRRTEGRKPVVIRIEAEAEVAPELSHRAPLGHRTSQTDGRSRQLLGFRASNLTIIWGKSMWFKINYHYLR